MTEDLIFFLLGWFACVVGFEVDHNLGSFGGGIAFITLTIFFEMRRQRHEKQRIMESFRFLRQVAGREEDDADES